MQKSTAVVRCFVLALILAIGLALAWGVVWSSLWVAVARQFAEQTPERGTYEQFLVRTDGTPAINAISYANYNNQKLRSLDGQPLERWGQIQSGNLPDPAQLDNSVLRTDWSSRIISWMADSQGSPEHWYLIDDAQAQGHAWLEGFNTVTKQRIGYLGCGGFRTVPLDAEERFPFDGRLKNAGGQVTGWAYWGIANSRSGDWTPEGVDRIPGWHLFLVSDGSLWEIDLRRRTVRTLLRDAGLISAAVVEQAVSANSYPQGPLNQHVAARSADRLWIINPRSGATRQFPLRADLHGRFLEVYELSDGVLLHALDRPDYYMVSSSDLVWLDREGKVTRERRIPVPVQQVAYSSDENWPQIITTAPIPVLLGIGAFVAAPLAMVDRGVATSYAEALAGALDHWKWPMLLVALP